jgi:glutamate N-acetyltransferase/amino-acid N-acetyltransferase
MKDSKELLIRVVLNQGSEDKRFFTCDLSYDYVKINAEYTT